MSPALLTFVGILIGALAGAGGVVAYLRLNRVDQPVAAADIDQKRADTRRIEVETLRDALEALQGWAKEAYGKVAELNTQVIRLEAAHESVNAQLQELRTNAGEARVLLAVHGQWDQLVLTEVRRHNPDFPEPPPLHWKQ